MSLMPVDQALEIISQSFSRLETESIALAQALGRTAAEDHHAKLTQPPFDASAMDGYAVRAADVAKCPVDLTVIGEAPAGQSFDGTVQPGTCIRIFTGGPVPKGADTVIMQENTDRLDESTVRIMTGTEQGRNVRPAGNDFTEGQMLIAAGTALTSRHIGMMAAANIAVVTVTRRPRIALLSTGDELVTIGDPVGPNQIISSNTLLLSSLIVENGGEAIDLGIARDTVASLEQKIALLKATDKVDLLITIGGASVGDHDLVQKVLGDHGLTVIFWKIAMRPGKPMIFGDFNALPMIGLPGNPASAYVCAVNFMLPALHIMLGRPTPGAPKSIALLAHDLPDNGSRQNYMRAHYQNLADGSRIVTATPRQDSAKLSTLAQSNCLLIRPPHAPKAAAGEPVDILLLLP
ncbi:MAG: molybdopterin molybdenumtransferase MoeA [Alphaproteobacteria bacterium]|nr:MAG: molybdopterin molybdenumtransferase MoeA [Alphaproteobacteria bacterium]